MERLKTVSLIQSKTQPALIKPELGYVRLDQAVANLRDLAALNVPNRTIAHNIRALRLTHAAVEEILTIGGSIHEDGQSDAGLNNELLAKIAFFVPEYRPHDWIHHIRQNQINRVTDPFVKSLKPKAITTYVEPSSACHLVSDGNKYFFTPKHGQQKPPTSDLFLLQAIGQLFRKNIQTTTEKVTPLISRRDVARIILDEEFCRLNS